jgi:hypothetical protein
MEWVGGAGLSGIAIPMVYRGTDCGVSPLIIRKKFSLGVNLTAIPDLLLIYIIHGPVRSRTKQAPQVRSGNTHPYTTSLIRFFMI